jgi:hypothetical protein
MSLRCGERRRRCLMPDSVSPELREKAVLREEGLLP